MLVDPKAPRSGSSKLTGLLVKMGTIGVLLVTPLSTQAGQHREPSRPAGPAEFTWTNRAKFHPLAAWLWSDTMQMPIWSANVDRTKLWTGETNQIRLFEPGGQTLIPTTAGATTNLEKLKRLRISELSFDMVPLGEVVERMRKESVKSDPDRSGVVIFPVGFPPRQQGVTGTGEALANPITIESVRINVPLRRDVRFLDALDAVVRGAEQPILCRIEDSGVQFSPRPLIIQHIQLKVNAAKFLQALTNSWLMDHLKAAPEPVPPHPLSSGEFYDDNSDRDRRYFLHEMVRDYFAKQTGADLDRPYMVFFNERTSIVYVKAADRDLNLIRQIVEASDFLDPGLGR